MCDPRSLRLSAKARMKTYLLENAYRYINTCIFDHAGDTTTICYDNEKSRTSRLTRKFRTKTMVTYEGRLEGPVRTVGGERDGVQVVSV